jgi:hypothetical protein
LLKSSRAIQLPYHLKYISIIFYSRAILTFIFSHHNSSSKSDEADDDVDSRHGRKIYNLTDILSTPSSGFYKYERHQQKQAYKQLHYTPSPAPVEKPQIKDRYYIYSHTKSDNDGAEDRNRDDSSRKVRSSTLSDRKQVSRNISMVLENLLMSYENSQLPTHGQGKSRITDEI